MSTLMHLPTNRRAFLRLAGAAAVVAAQPIRSVAQAAKQDFVASSRAAAAKTPIQVTKLADNIHLLQGYGGNMAVQTGPDGKLLIDSSYMPAAPRILAALEAISKDPASTLVNTHWHVDHVDGNQPMHEAGFQILAHSKTRERLRTPQSIGLLHLSMPAYPQPAWPVTTFEQSMTLWRNGDRIHMEHYAPAHTDTDIFLHFQHANVLHVADIWFNGVYPLIDESSGGNIDGMIHASAQALQLADNQTRIIPGHGPLGTRAQLVEYHAMLSTVRDNVARLKKAGLSEQETIARKPTAALDAKWGKGGMTPDVFTGIVYRTVRV